MNTHRVGCRAVAAFVRADFVAAVVLTVLAPLILLASAVRNRQGALAAALVKLLACVEPVDGGGVFVDRRAAKRIGVRHRGAAAYCIHRAASRRSK